MNIHTILLNNTYIIQLEIWEKVITSCTDGEPAMAGINNDGF